MFTPYEDCGNIPGANLLVCTDMGAEPADFIVASDKKLCFIHVKCGKSSISPKSSAGALAEVGGQAIKNMEPLISRRREYKPGNWTELNSAWPRPNDAIKLKHRVRLIDGSFPEEYMLHNNKKADELMTEAWDKVNNLRTSAAVEKEVWIIVGNAFSRSDFVNNLSKGHLASSVTLQAYQLIDSWLSICASNEIDFKIFVSP
jgi:hypothetical protein